MEVTGKDKTSPGLEWVFINGNNTLQAKLYDGSSVTAVKATLLPVDEVRGLDDVTLKKPEKPLEFMLNDLGRDGDVTPGDRVFSKKISATSCYFYRVKIEAADASGNTSDESGQGAYIVYAD
jgi:hypothetical protein